MISYCLLFFLVEKLCFDRQTIVTLMNLFKRGDMLHCVAFFQCMQQIALRDLADMLLFRKSAKRELETYFPYIQKYNGDVSKDAFLREMLIHMYKKRMYDITHKFQVPIPESQGRLLLGVTDETKTLKSGEVFIKISKQVSNNYEANNDFVTIKGNILLSKNPCLFLSDIQKAVAVEPTSHEDYFKHLTDCIVFSQEGDRPLPDQIAGSDLDGDEFWAVWLNLSDMNREDTPAETWWKILYGLFDKIDVKPAHVFESEINKKKQFCPNIDELRTNFLNFSKKNIIKDLEELHVCFAAIDVYKPNLKCEKIAKDFTTAVDATKSGMLWFYVKDKAEFRCPAFPYFMQKKGKKCCDIGQGSLLYRLFITGVSIFEVTFKLESSYKILELSQKFETLTIDNQRETFTQNIMQNKYKTKLSKYISTLGLNSEAELFCAAHGDLVLSKYMNRWQRTYLVEYVRLKLDDLRDMIRKEFSENVGASSFLMSHDYGNDAQLNMVRHSNELQIGGAILWMIIDLKQSIRNLISPYKSVSSSNRKNVEEIIHNLNEARETIPSFLCNFLEKLRPDKRMPNKHVMEMTDYALQAILTRSFDSNFAVNELCSYDNARSRKKRFTDILKQYQADNESDELSSTKLEAQSDTILLVARLISTRESAFKLIANFKLQPNYKLDILSAEMVIEERADITSFCKRILPTAMNIVSKLIKDYVDDKEPDRLSEKKVSTVYNSIQAIVGKLASEAASKEQCEEFIEFTLRKIDSSGILIILILFNPFFLEIHKLLHEMALANY